MKKYILTLFSALLLLSCNNIKKIRGDKKSVQVDKSKITILPLDSVVSLEFKDCKPTDLSTKDLYKIEIIIRECISEYNKKEEKVYNEIKHKNPQSQISITNFIIDLNKYKRQYIAVINTKGEKEVWVNCFCGTMPNWTKKIIYVFDGGNCYFNLKINLKQNKYYELIVNDFV